MRGQLRSLLIGVIGGIFGVMLGLIIYALWVDHSHVTDLWNLEIRRAQAAQQSPQGK